MSTNGKGAAQAAPTLPELGGQVHKRMTEMDKAAADADRTSLLLALEVGALLSQAKPRMPRGEWMQWLEKYFPRHHTTANRYMMLADPANSARVQNCVSLREAIEAVRAPRRIQQASKPKTNAREAGRRLRGLYKQRRQHDTELVQARIDISKMVQVLEVVDIPGLGVGNADDETLAEILQELTIASAWVDGSLAVVAVHLGEQEIREQIRKLREDTNGRTPHEIKTAAKIADRLEQRLRQAALQA